jgi:hypothetical protein
MYNCIRLPGLWLYQVRPHFHLGGLYGEKWTPSGQVIQHEQSLPPFMVVIYNYDISIHSK